MCNAQTHCVHLIKLCPHARCAGFLWLLPHLSLHPWGSIYAVNSQIVAPDTYGHSSSSYRPAKDGQPKPNHGSDLVLRHQSKQSHCIKRSLRHCIKRSLRHCIKRSLRHCIKRSLRHQSTQSRDTARSKTLCIAAKKWCILYYICISYGCEHLGEEAFWRCDSVVRMRKDL
jgi:hypothetical protein